MRRKKTTPGQDSSGLHVWLVFFESVSGAVSARPPGASSGQNWATPISAYWKFFCLRDRSRSIRSARRPGSRRDRSSVAVDRLVEKGLVSRKDHPDDRRVRQVELTPKGRALISRGFGEHAAAMEDVANVLSKNERLTLLRLLKKLGKHAAETRK